MHKKLRVEEDGAEKHAAGAAQVHAPAHANPAPVVAGRRRQRRPPPPFFLWF